MTEELQEKIKFLTEILGTETKVTHNSTDYTVTGLIQRRIRGQKIITVELTPLNGANSLTYCRVQDIERTKNDRTTKGNEVEHRASASFTQL